MSKVNDEVKASVPPAPAKADLVSLAVFRAINQNDKELVELAKNLSRTVDLWEHDFELSDGRIVRLMNVDKIGGQIRDEIWGVYADAGKGALVVEEQIHARTEKRK